MAKNVVELLKETLPEETEMHRKLQERLDNSHVGSQLVLHRIAAGLTPEELAEKLNISSYWLKILESHDDILRIETIKQYLRACGVSGTVTIEIKL